MHWKSINAYFTILLIIAFAARQKCYSESGGIRFNHLSDFPELSNNTVFSIIQDPNGYLWFGTYNGLYKYDGYTLKSYSSNTSSGNVLPAIPVRMLYMDRHGNLWIGTSGKSLWVMDFKTEHFFLYRSLYPGLDKLSDNIADICEDKENNLWLCTIDKAVQMISGKDHILHEYNSPMLPNVARCLCDSRDRIMVTDLLRNIFVYDRQKDVFIYTGINQNQNIINFIAKKTALQAELEENHNQKISGPKPEFPLKSVEDELPYRPVIKDKNGLLWIGTDVGLYTYDPKTDILEAHCHTFADENSFNGNIVYAFLQDGAGNLWIGTDMGINKINFAQQDFYNFPFDISDDIDTRYIRSLYIDNKGTLWLGTFRGGLNYVKNNRIVHYIKRKSFPVVVNTITEDHTGKIWFGGLAGFGVLDKNRKPIEANQLFPGIYDSIRAAIWAIQEDNAGNTWIGTTVGLYKIDLAGKRSSFFKHKQNDKTSLAGSSVWCLFKDHNGTLWVGTNDGLSEILNVNNKITFRNFRLDTRNTLSPDPYNVWYIYEDRQHILWLATTDHGLCRFDKSNGSVSNYNESNGFPSEMLCGILEDKQSKFWISTAKGLCVFDPAQKRVVKTYYESNGLFSSQFNYKCCFKDSSGRMYFGGKTGFVSFDPNLIKTINYEPHILVSSFRIAYQERIHEFLKDSSVSISYPDKDFSIGFSSTDFTNPAQSQFSYKLAGLNDQWIDLGNNHSLIISNLSAGSYRLLIRTRNNKGLWSSHIFRAAITVHPPFWQAWWFRIIIILAILGAVTLIVRYYLAKKDRQRQKLITELGILRSQLNPHFIFNSLNSLQSFIITNQKNLALEYVERFAHIMRLILENSRKEVILLSEEIAFLELYFYMESIRGENRIKFELRSDPRLQAGAIKIPPMLIQPFVENALKHGQLTTRVNGKISVDFQAFEDHFKVIVEDNGVGREIAKKFAKNLVYKRESIGIENIVSRLNLISDAAAANKGIQIIDLYDKAGNPAGTRVEMIIPYL